MTRTRTDPAASLAFNQYPCNAPYEGTQPRATITLPQFLSASSARECFFYHVIRTGESSGINYVTRLQFHLMMCDYQFTRFNI